jgi:LuxR family transcriptional regulator, quorum-sensing system regulator CinR
VIEAIASAKTSAESITLIRQQFDVHVASLLAHSKVTPLDVPWVRATYPKEWITEYLLHGYANSDPVVKQGFTKTVPFEWSEINLDRAGLAMMKAAEKHGIGRSGYSIPVTDLQGRRGLFSINSHRDGLEWRFFLQVNAAMLAELANIIHRRLITETCGGHAFPRLSKREKSALQLSAQGYDYNAVADKLGISYHTAKSYLASARNKLDAVTTSQAVAKAISLRLISPVS